MMPMKTPLSSSSQLTITAQPNSSTELSPLQKKFNALVRRIAKQREQLKDWELARTVFAQRYQEQLQPAQHRLHQTQVALLCLLDARSSIKLAKADKVFLSRYISDRAWNALQEEDDASVQATLKDIFLRHSGEDYDAEMQAQEMREKHVLQEMIGAMFGVEMELDDLDTPEAMLAKFQQTMQSQQLDDDADDGASMHALGAFQQAEGKPQRRKKPSARERKAQEVAKETSQSVREIYRKLASELHPDRVMDPMERERKTALMQRVNQAYTANDLLQLLELQWECEQIDAAHLATVGEARLKHYTQVLNTQCQHLKLEVLEREQDVVMQFQLPLHHAFTPKKLIKFLTDKLQHTKRESQRVEELTALLTQDPRLFKTWLKQERVQQNMREVDELFLGGDQEFFY